MYKCVTFLSLDIICSRFNNDDLDNFLSKSLLKFWVELDSVSSLFNFTFFFYLDYDTIPYHVLMQREHDTIMILYVLF